MAFIQTIEMTTSRFDEIEALVEEFLAKTAGRRTARRATITADRDKPNTYLQIIEFDSWEAAQENSNLPETTEMAGKLAALCDGPPTFRNLDVRRVEDM